MFVLFLLFAGLHEVFNDITCYCFSHYSIVMYHLNIFILAQQFCVIFNTYKMWLIYLKTRQHHVVLFLPLNSSRWNVSNMFRVNISNSILSFFRQWVIDLVPYCMTSKTSHSWKEDKLKVYRYICICCIIIHFFLRDSYRGEAEI